MRSLVGLIAKGPIKRLVRIPLSLIVSIALLPRIPLPTLSIIILLTVIALLPIIALVRVILLTVIGLIGEAWLAVEAWISLVRPRHRRLTACMGWQRWQIRESRLIIRKHPGIGVKLVQIGHIQQRRQATTGRSQRIGGLLLWQAEGRHRSAQLISQLRKVTDAGGRVLR